MSMKGWLIYNGSIRNDKFMELNQLYYNAARKQNVLLDIISNDEIFNIIHSCYLGLDTFASQSKVDFVLFLDKDIYLAKLLEKMGYRLFNNAKAIEVCGNKILTYMELANNGLIIPKTIFAPLKFNENVSISDSYIKHIENKLDYPLIIKEAYDSFGQQVYLINNREELLNKINELGIKPHLYQEYIRSSFGKDIRVQVVGSKVVAGMLRENNNDLSFNITNGDKMSKIDIPIEFQNTAIKSCNILGLDFAYVDIMFGKYGEPIVCEVNSNAHIKNLIGITGIDVAEEIIKYIKGVINKK